MLRGNFRPRGLHFIDFSLLAINLRRKKVLPQGRTERCPSPWSHRERTFRFALGVLLCTGCGSDNGLELFPVRGEVIYNGKPVVDGTIAYLPQNAPARQATGAIQPDGSFALMTRKQDDGAMRGSYRIAIYAYKPHPGEPKTREEHEALARKGGLKREYLIPAKYADPSTSGLADTVDEKHPGFKKFELSD